MALDALCEHTESAAIDVCEVGGTARLADAMAEVYHNQLTQDIMQLVASHANAPTLLALKAVSRDYHEAVKPADDPLEAYTTELVAKAARGD